MKENEKKDKRQRRGLYFALAVCLIAIAVAGSATYSSVMDYVNNSSEAAIGEDKDPETQVNTEAERNSPPVILSEGEASSEEETESVNAEPEYTSEESEEEEEEEESTEEVNTEPAYTPSDSLGFPVKATDVYRPFSGSALVYSETMRDYRVHAGADMAAEQGETVNAIGNGSVISTYKDHLLGNVIEIEHGEYIVKYCGLGDTFLVNEGDIVSKGTAIGSIYETPFENDGTAHIHIEITKDGAGVDPAEVMAQ